MITEEQAIAISDNLLLAHTGKPLNDLERAVLKGSLQRQKYQQIATNTHQTQRYIKDIGAALWRKLTDALGGIPVKKNTIYSVLDRYSDQQSLGAYTSRKQTVNATVFSEYHQSYLKKHSQIKILPGLMQRPLPLDAIYVAVKVLKKSNVQLLSSTTIQEAYRQLHRSTLLGTELARQDGVQVAEENQYLMVLGGPGVGKSTFLKKLGLEAFHKEDLCIPVLIELRRVASSNASFEDYALKAFQEIKTVQEAGVATAHLAQGNCLFLLDGLDEVPKSSVHRLIDQLHEFIHQYRKNRFVITCRTASHIFNFNQFLDVIIADFDDEQIKQFIDYWFVDHWVAADQQRENERVNNGLTRAEHFWQRLQATDNIAIKELARSPLLLTYLCLICEQGNPIPHTRKDLYLKALELVLNDWDRQKNIHPCSPLSDYGFTASLEQQLLSEIAYENFDADRVLFSKQYLLKKIHSFLREHLLAPEKTEQSLTANLILNAMVTRQGILIERFVDYFSFSHLTFQEYLTAVFLVRHQRVTPMLTQYMADSRWREVILLTSELMEADATNLIAMIKSHIDRGIQGHPKLFNIIQKGNHLLTAAQIQSTLSQRASIMAAISTITSARESAADLATHNSKQAAHALPTACEVAMLISPEPATFHDTFHKAAVTSTVAIVCARAIAYAMAEAVSAEEVHQLSFTVPTHKATAIDEVVQAASELINNASDDHGLIKQYNRSQIVVKSLGFSLGLIQCAKSQNHFLSNISKKLSQSLLCLSHRIPPAAASAEDWYQWSNQLEFVWIDTLTLDRASLALSPQEAQVWQRYIYLTELLVRCLESNIHMASSMQTQVEQQLLITE